MQPPPSFPGAVQLVRTRHISGLGANLVELSPEQRASVAAVRAAVSAASSGGAGVTAGATAGATAGPHAAALGDYLDDAALVNFLIARDWQPDRALQMMRAALEWRSKRPSHRYFTQPPPGPVSPAEAEAIRRREHSFQQSASSGKIRVPGCDKHGALLALAIFFAPHI